MWIIEIYVVESIEGFSPELQAVSLERHLEVFHNRDIKVGVSR